MRDFFGEKLYNFKNTLCSLVYIVHKIITVTNLRKSLQNT